MTPLNPADEQRLFDACENGRIADIADVLQRDPAAIDRQTPEGWSPLILAVQWAQEDTVAYLLAQGANMDLCDNSGCTARELADRLNFESIGNQFRLAVQAREELAQEQRTARAIEQYRSGLETPVTLSRRPFQLKF